MAPGLDGGLGVNGEEIGRDLQEHGVRFDRQETLVGVQPGKAAFLGHVEAGADTLRHRLEIVSNGAYLKPTVFGQIVRDPRATPTAADEADGDFRIGGGTEDDRRCDNGKRRGQGRGGEELTAWHGWGGGGG